MRTPLTILTGYLGSGKTTLLRHVLAATGQKIAVIMNEFGELDIDAKLVKGKNIDIAELSSGCVCCSLTGEFAAAVDELIATARPDHIVVETTGVVDPESLIADVQDMEQLRLDSVVCVIDCDALSRYPEIGQTQRIQIEMADVILLNKADLASKEKITEIEKRVAAMNSTALMHRTVHCAVDPALLFGVHGEKDAQKKLHAELEVLQSFAFATGKAFDKEKFERFVTSLPRRIVRAKGFVIFTEGSFLFNYVFGRSTYEPFSAERTELVFIGKGMDETAMREALQRCIP